ncbi:hypothetical protein [Roseateles sp.]|uniref:hypothetical protein n=1 Tax=Roseateles sp. TaxID=1971397 RepID=UPI0031E21C3E
MRDSSINASAHALFPPPSEPEAGASCASSGTTPQIVDAGLPLQATPSAPVAVRLGRCLFSSRPKVIDDFSGSGLLSALRMVARLRNLDGPDDLAGAIPAGFSEANQPYIEIGLLAALFPLVAIAAHGAVRSAKAGYQEVYPQSVQKVLDQQRQLIEALRHANECDAADAARDPGHPYGDIYHRLDQELRLRRLERLNAAGVRRFENRQHHREKGWFSIPLAGHNLVSKIRGVPGNAMLSEQFSQAAAELLAARFAHRRAAAASQTPGADAANARGTYFAEVDYQHHLSCKLNVGLPQAKRGRIAWLFSGIGMPGMASGMATSAGASAAKAAGQLLGGTAPRLAEQALESATGGLMIGAQLAQGMAGACNFRLHRAEHRQLKADHDAARGLSAHLSPTAFKVYEGDAAFRLADSARDQVFDAMLTAGQGLMLGASISNFACPPVAAALAAPGALLTIGASIGAGVNEKHRADFLGDQTPETVKSQMRWGNLGPRLREHALDTVLQEVAGGFEGYQEQVVRTRLWNDLLKVLKKEDALDERSSHPAAERHRRLVERTERRKGAAHLLPVGVERLRALRDERYPLPNLAASTAVLHERLAQELRAHPASDAIIAQPSFQRDVLFATAQDLAHRNRPDTRALFFDARGRRKPTLPADAQFFDFLDGNDAARTVYLQHHNEALVRALTPTDLFGRADSRDALTDLAHVMRERALRQRP